MTNTTPHALENLPPLNCWTDEALVRDLIEAVVRDTVSGAGVRYGDPQVEAMRDEILRRMTR